MRPWSCPLSRCLRFAFDIKRPEVRSFIDTMTREHGFEKAKLEALLKTAETKQPILDAISRPAERVVPWWEYRERFLTEKRINQGADFWVGHGEKLRQIPDPQLANVVVGILGVETSFGRITGKYKVLDALVTLGFDYLPRGRVLPRRAAKNSCCCRARRRSIRPPCSAPMRAPWARRSSSPPATASGRWTAMATVIATCGTAGTT